VSDEWLAIFKQLWTQSPATFKGRFYDYADIRCEPLPLQKPHPPIWVGGHSPAALRRTARHADGWHPVGAVAASPLPPDEVRTHLATLRKLTEAEGRDFSRLHISYKAPLYDTGIPDRDGNRRSFAGTPEQIADDIHSFAKIGVHELIFDFRGQSEAESVERLQRFAAEVMTAGLTRRGRSPGQGRSGPSPPRPAAGENRSAYFSTSCSPVNSAKPFRVSSS
jgi:alkanesulfonate monooxygenase SsuD/methylene tetrahydromethanopterin reductase-like flavin-dependent oxidoreductase (luciferase family)